MHFGKPNILLVTLPLLYQVWHSYKGFQTTNERGGRERREREREREREGEREENREVGREGRTPGRGGRRIPGRGGGRKKEEIGKEVRG